MYESDRTPVRTLEDLASFDESEIVEGYWSGRDGDPEPGHNRSRAFWHGWRNGAVDGGHRQMDAAQAELARAFLQAMPIRFSPKATKC